MGPLSGWGPGQNASVVPPLWAALTAWVNDEIGKPCTNNYAACLENMYVSTG